MSFVAIRTELKAIVDGIKVAAGIATVYDYPPTNVGNTPAVAIMDNESDDDYADTGNNAVTTSFVIRTIVEKGKSTTNSTQVTALLTVVDALLVELRKKEHATLNCQSHSLLISSSSTEVGSIGDLDVWYKDITVVVESFKTVV